MYTPKEVYRALLYKNSLPLFFASSSYIRLKPRSNQGTTKEQPRSRTRWLNAASAALQRVVLKERVDDDESWLPWTDEQAPMWSKQELFIFRLI
ncbi:hypothetical protein RJ55_07775 [Drechmeria coniospora]|nr:hypothetical protein RJ55_07775 [Drechmeria coniospora]